MWIGSDLHIVQHPRAEQSAALDIRRQQLQHRGPLPLHAAGRGRDRRVQCRRQLGGQRIAQFENPCLSDQSALPLIDAADQQFQFLQVPWCGPDDQRVGPDIGGHGHSRGHPFRSSKNIFHRGGSPQYRFVSQTVDPQLRFGRHGLIQLGDQFLHRHYRLAPTDQQESVRFDQRCHANLTLSPADQVHGDHVQDHCQGHTVGVSQLVEVDHRHRFGTESFDFGNDASHLVHIRVTAAQDDHIQVRQRLDLDAVAQLPKPRINILLENAPIRQLSVWQVIEGDLLTRGRRVSDRFGKLYESNGQPQLPLMEAGSRYRRICVASAALAVPRRLCHATAVGVNGLLYLGRIGTVHGDDADRRFRLPRSVLRSV